MMAAKDMFSKKKSNGDDILFESVEINMEDKTDRENYLEKSNKQLLDNSRELTDQSPKISNLLAPDSLEIDQPSENVENTDLIRYCLEQKDLRMNSSKFRQLTLIQ